MERPYDISASVQLSAVRYLHTMRFLKEMLSFCLHFPQLIDAFQRMKALSQGTFVSSPFLLPFLPPLPLHPFFTPTLPSFLPPTLPSFLPLTLSVPLCFVLLVPLFITIAFFVSKNYLGPDRKIRLLIEVEAGGPMLLIPKHAFSPELVGGAIGRFTVHNKFLYDGDEGTLSCGQKEDKAASAAAGTLPCSSASSPGTSSSLSHSNRFVIESLFSRRAYVASDRVYSRPLVQLSKCFVYECVRAR